MPDPEKSVFISYRRDISQFHARAILMDLLMHDFEAFMDVASLDSGKFDVKLLRQIEARPHFIIILAPGVLDRCADADDWLRREIEHALDTERNIVPVMIGGFRFADYDHLLTGKLAELPRYSGLPLYHEYFDEGMERLRTRFLHQPARGKITPVPTQELKIALEQLNTVKEQPKPTPAELTAEEYLTRAYAQQEAGNLDGAIADYTRSIELNPHYYKTFYNRGLCYYDQKRLYMALEDFDTAIRQQPNYRKARYNRGIVRYKLMNFAGAVEDFTEVIQLDPQSANGYNNRGLTYRAMHNLKAAVDDFTAAIARDPGDVALYLNRANAYHDLGEVANAVADYTHYLTRGGAAQYGNRGEIEAALDRLRHNVSGSSPADNLADMTLTRTLPHIPIADATPPYPPPNDLLSKAEIITGVIPARGEGSSTSRDQAYAYPVLPPMKGKAPQISYGPLGSAYSKYSLTVDESNSPMSQQSWWKRILLGKKSGERPIPKRPQSNILSSPEPSTTPLQPPSDISPMQPLGGTRPIPPLPLTALSSFGLTIGKRTDSGMVHEENQDTVYTFVASGLTDEQPPLALLIVADGMGGHQEGQKASALAVQTVVREFQQHFYLPFMISPHDPDRATPTEILCSAFERANEAVTMQLPDGGTTLTAAAILGNLAYIAHVGDSRAYLIQSNGAEQLTRDHSLVARLIELDQLTPEEARDHYQKNVLYRAIGQSETLEVDTLTRRLGEDTVLLLCSDGLWGIVTNEEIPPYLADNVQNLCDQLVALARQRGAPDNVSVIAAQVAKM